MSYVFSVESLRANTPQLIPLYAEHYREMQERLAADGIEISKFNPRIQTYFDAEAQGGILNLVVRVAETGEPVGYCNVYITNDMHNGDLIAQEDTVFIRKEHRNGVGKQLVKFGLEELRRRGVKRLHVTAMTDLRVEKLWRRMGFKPVATSMIYQF